jgi:hypothetical protein
LHFQTRLRAAMTPIRILACLSCLLTVSAAQAQEVAPPAPAEAAAAAATGEGAGAQAEAGESAAEGERAWRDTSAYTFGALAATALRPELVAKAMQLRDYCADQRVDDAFVRERLQRFSALSGREEDCRTLLDY